MNKVILCGRLTKDVTTTYAQGNEPMAISRYTLAVDRRKNNEADFINCVAFGKQGEFAEKYLKKGMKMIVTGRIQTGSYTNKDGLKVYTTDIVVEEHEFAESKSSQVDNGLNQINTTIETVNDFMSIPEGLENELPFN